MSDKMVWVDKSGTSSMKVKMVESSGCWCLLVVCWEEERLEGRNGSKASGGDSCARTPLCIQTCR